MHSRKKRKKQTHTENRMVCKKHMQCAKRSEYYRKILHAKENSSYASVCVCAFKYAKFCGDEWCESKKKERTQNLEIFCLQSKQNFQWK